ncbi:MAG: SUMF1/EgtB/PvdO family nonheme iron enzyme [Rhodospirillales bacterium]|nr:SUMF1/EgtB/PvdO family nonheme iron enzyme [Rhodospirillales bacterium]
MADPPKVFISYSHDDERHEERVLELANRLRLDGIDAEIDQYIHSPPEGWPLWCEQKIEEAGFVLLVCTQTYHRRVANKEEAGVGHGVVWEARIIRQLLYDAGSVSEKFIPVLFSDGNAEHIPRPVKGATRYKVDTASDYERLCRHLTSQPMVVKPALGAPRALPPRTPKTRAAAGARPEMHAAASPTASPPVKANAGHGPHHPAIPPAVPAVKPRSGDRLAPDAIRWLHLSDLHMGCRGAEIWWQVRSEFKDSIKQCFRPIDMILLTGDLTFSAQPAQFELVDRFLEDLLGWLREAGQESDPLVIPVPGNHDVLHLDDLDIASFYNLDNFWKDPEHPFIESLRKRLWEGRNAAYFGPLFGNYVGWLERSILPPLAGRQGVVVHRSHFPGDIGVRVRLGDRPPATIVGLNSAWVQYNKGDFDRRIELFTQQLHCALGNDAAVSPFDGLAGCLNLLLMHHPPAWLSAKASQRFREEVYPPDRFLLCLHGHMHEGRSEAISCSGGKLRYFFQAPSLFGVEHYGQSNETRSMGYAWGEMDATGTVRVFPLKRGSQGGRQVFLWDSEFEPDPAGRQIRPLIVDPSTVIAAPDLTPWLEALLERIGYVEISGIGSGVGRTRDATRYPIEQLYTTLRSQDATEGLTGRAEPVALAELASRHPLLLIEGQPGAGKTTFLRLAATMLAKDFLRMPCPSAPSWREKYLGMSGREKAPAPIFLRLSKLATLLTELGDTSLPDDHQRLLDLLARSSGKTSDAWRRHWERLLERGEAVLLLDGMDEVADDCMRERIFAIFRDARLHWDKARVVVTSRPFGVEAIREMGFHHAKIEDFGKKEIREFVERWVAALHNLPIGERPEGAAGEKADGIIQDVLRRRGLRRMAANPVMLTCLCVVHWNEGDLPEGRARLYRAVLRWLIAARSPQRNDLTFTDRFALEAFAAVAFAMMVGAVGEKSADLDFGESAEAIVSVAERHFPIDIGIRRAREWLRFECLWSGIIEEESAGRVRFWHLTFQEYLAAQELAWRRDRDGAEDWWPAVKGRLDDPQWRETVDLLPGVLFDEGGRGRVDLLLRRVIALREGPASLATDARVFGILGRILRSMTAYQYKPTREIEAVYNDLEERILAIFSLDGAVKVPVKTRIEAAEALGRSGDPRLDRDCFIEVPDTSGVSLGKYPVTVQDYQAFVDADGYKTDQYWDDEGWRSRSEGRWVEPDGWDAQLEHPNRPVTGVSWYEASAFCRWRSSDSDWTFRLPNEAEWLAASAPDGRTYPWGAEEPDPKRANFNRNVGAPTPVGVYPASDGPYGHCDLAGNVWEWMNDDLEETKSEDHEGIQSSRNRVLRGGSWYVNPGILRSAFRYRYVPVNRVSVLGFRVARTLD